MVARALYEQGFSLIELMVTIAILGILAITGIALTGKWSQQVELDKAVMSLNSSMALAKSTAMRNGGGRATTEASSQLCFDNATKVLTVHEATPAIAASCSIPTVFQYQLGSAITINEGGTGFLCYSLNSLGLASSTGSCTTTLSFTIANGTLNETVDLS